MNLIFRPLIELVSSDKGKHSRELIKNIDNNKFDINYVTQTELRKDIAISTYDTRAKINKELHNLDIDEIGYTGLLKSLNELEEDTLIVTSVPTEICTFKIFTSNDFKILLGIIRSDNSNLKKAIFLRKQRKEKGYS
ncbi:MAG: hypothetical protein AAF849_22475 [Bacteroidota bacterium]